LNHILKILVMLWIQLENFLKNEFQVPEKKISLIFNAVDIESLDRRLCEKDRLSMLKKFGIPENAYVIGIIARLVEDKGHQHLLEALNILKPKYPHMHVLIVGDGKERSHLEASVKHFGLEGSVTFAGNQDDITGPLSIMSLFTLPATWREGFGLSIIEAMTAHVPIIVTNIWALNTLVQNEQTGILIPAKDSRSLASAIQRVFESPDLASKLTREGRLMVEKSFGIEHFADLITETYQSCFHPKS
jgi:glycosyltransferase involved in cell wall biosynthesis